MLNRRVAGALNPAVWAMLYFSRACRASCYPTIAANAQGRYRSQIRRTREGVGVIQAAGITVRQSLRALCKETTMAQRDPQVAAAVLERMKREALGRAEPATPTAA